MRRNLFALIIGALVLATTAWGHGGTFRGPNGGVPPGLREPSDPEPPPPESRAMVVFFFFFFLSRPTGHPPASSEDAYPYG